MILTIRGTSGSGKSTIAFTLLKNFPFDKVLDDKGKILGYRVDAGLKKPIYLVGKYETACGGTDAISTQKESCDRALRWAEAGGHVILEGLLLSGGGPKAEVTARVTETGDYCHCFLDTPVEICLDRVRARRAAKGNDKPLNTANTEMKFDQCISTYKTLRAEGYKVALIDHTRAYNQVMEILGAAS